jgi:peroxiredoxin
MKKALFLLTLSAFAFTSSNAQKANVTGIMHFSKPVQMIYLSYSAGDERVTDSTKLDNGKFHFTAMVKEPTLAMLMVRFEPVSGEQRPHIERMQLFMEPGNINIAVKDSMELAKVSGSKSQKAFEALGKLEKPYNEKAEALSNKYRQYYAAKDTAAMKNLEGEFDNLSKEKDEKVYHQYLTQNPNSPVALYVLNQYAGYDINAKKVEPLFQKLPAATRNLPSGIALKKRIEIAKKTGVGAYAMNFTQPDTLSKPVSLSDFKGKYVLLDFWASWCGPCRAENPNVVKAFNEYKDKNFTVLSVSLDQPGKKQAWLDAIHKDGLTWNHVSDLKFWDNAVAKEYGIRAIPQNLLLDPSGKIIAKNIRGEELGKKLEEVIK